MADTGFRKSDRIDVTPRFTAVDAQRLNNLLRGSDTREAIEAVLCDGVAGKVTLISSFGAESAALLHLALSIDRSVPVLFLDTGKHFPETLAYRDTLLDRLDMRDLRILSPDPADLAEQDETGMRWSYDPDGCCDIRKVRPLERALAEFDTSITGRKAFQASTRSALPRFEFDGQRLKFNPLAGWSRDDIVSYFATHALPHHPLETQGYPSIGCHPCTSKVGPGEEPRSGRWSGWDKTECGIHNPA